MSKYNDEDTNPFFFFLRAKKKGMNFREDGTNDMDSYNLFRKSYHGKPFMKKKKKKQIEQKPKMKKTITRTFHVGDAFRDEFKYYFGCDGNLFSNGMKKHEWMSIVSQYNQYKQNYNAKKYQIEVILERRRELNEKQRKEKIRVLPDLHTNESPFDFYLKDSHIPKVRSMPNILSQLNKEHKVNFDHSLVIGKTNDDEYSAINSFTLFNLFNVENFYIFGVLEGKGFQSILLARIIKETLIKALSDRRTYRIKTPLVYEDDLYTAITENQFEMIKSLFSNLHNVIKENGYDIDSSGALLNMLIIIKRKMIFINLGTTQTYIYTKETIDSNNYKIAKINNVHHASNIIEQDRIESFGTLIEEDEFKEEKVDGSKKGINDKNINYTRIFGYRKLNVLGVINEPMIEMVNIENETQCVLIGTNYFWDCYDEKYYGKIINWYLTGRKGDAITIADYLMTLSKMTAKERFVNIYERCLLLIIFKL